MANGQWLTAAVSRAGNGTRTRDPNLGKVVLYQLSYSRVTPPAPAWRSADGQRPSTNGHGGEGNRTPDLLNAIQALSQLSYAPGPLSDAGERPFGNLKRYLKVIHKSTESPLARDRGARILQRKIAPRSSWWLSRGASHIMAARLQQIFSSVLRVDQACPTLVFQSQIQL
jgi:hypothetical protein